MYLFKRDVEASCKKHIDKHKKNCSGFIRAVASDLLILIPGISQNADGQVEFMRLINTPDFQHLGDGQAGEIRAVNWASDGHFVICGMRSPELQTHRPGRTINHGHVAVVVDGLGKTGWPLAYWGSLGGSPGIRESLSKSFRLSDRSAISYFGHIIPR